MTRRTLSALARVHLGSLIGFALAFAYLQAILVGEFLLIPTVFAVITAVIAVIIGTGWRWAALLGTLWLILVNAASMDVIGYHLARPENTHDFAFYVVVLGVAVVGVVSGIAALRQAMRADTPLMPRWLPSFLVGVAMLCTGAIAVVLIPRPAAASISPQALAELPALTTTNFAFDQTELRVKVGETVALRLENTDVATHAFAVPKLGVDVPMRSGEASLALFRPTAIGKYTFVCSVPSPLEPYVDVLIAPLVGPEIIAGSTRLKAGTAQKLVLNMLSTATMVQLGKVYGNLMVDVRATNAKLRDRAVRIVMAATGVDRATAEAVLSRAGGECKVAIVMLLAGVDRAEAERRLALSGGRVREAVGTNA